MNSYLINYIFGFLICSNILFAWYKTTFGEKILSVFMRDKHLLYEEIVEKIENNFFKDLFYCPVCLGTWFSFFISIVFFMFDLFNLYFVFFAIFSWPLLSYKIFLK